MVEYVYHTLDTPELEAKLDLPNGFTPPGTIRVPLPQNQNMDFVFALVEKPRPKITNYFRAEVRDLEPGRLVRSTPWDSGPLATFVARVDRHPLWPDLCMVVWKMADGSWMHDALAPSQMLEYCVRQNHHELKENLRKALLHPSQTSRPKEES